MLTVHGEELILLQCLSSVLKENFFRQGFELTAREILILRLLAERSSLDCIIWNAEELSVLTAYRMIRVLTLS